MSKIKQIGIGIISVFALVFTLEGCNEYTLLGDNMVGGYGDAKALATDTFTINTSTIFENQDSVFGTTTTNVTTGVINADSIFGKTIASAYIQLGLASSGADFKEPNPVLDSVVLSLRYAGYYGDSLGAQTYTVYKITDPAFSDTTLKYYTHQKFNIDKANPLGTITVKPKDIADSITLFDIKVPPQLRIRLNNTFGDDLLSQTSDDALANDSAFHKWLNGIALIPDSTTPDRNSLIYFELDNAYTGINLYYHNSQEDSLFAYFPFNVQTGVWSNYRRHDFSGTPVEKAIQDGEQETSLIYLQSQSGLYGNIRIPYLQNFPNAIINKAELIITQIDNPSNALFQPPYELFLWQYKNAARDSIGYIIDVGAAFSSLYGWSFANLGNFNGLGKYITNEDGQKVIQYRFNISRYVQHLIAGSRNETNYGFRLGIFDPQNRGRNVGRVILGGGNNSKYSIKLHVIYTKIQ